MVVVLLNRELDLRTRVRMAKTQNRSINVSGLELFDQFLTVLSETSKKVCNDFTGLAGLALEIGECGLDAACKISSTS
jgi:hypothetical protein